LSAEGLPIIKNANAGEVRRDEGAETMPLRHRELHRYNMNLPKVETGRRKPEAA
jgi:hypothetical protein